MDKLTIRRVDSRKNNANFLEKLFKFYLDNPSDMNSPRDPFELLKSTKADNIFYIERSEGEELCGAAASIRHTPSCLELGATRVTENELGLQKTLIACRIMNTIVETHPDFIFTAVSVENPASIKSSLGSGLKSWNPPSRFFYETGFDPAESAAMKLKFFAITQKAQMATAAQILLDTYRQPVRIRLSSGQSFYILLDIAMMRESSMRKIVEGIAAGNTGF